MLGRLLRALLVSGGEVLLAIVLVLVLGLAFTGILIFCFPEGNGLVPFYKKLVTRDRGDTNLALTSSEERGELVAELTTVQRRVRDRAATAIAWSNAEAGMSLSDHHTVQTLAGSAAAIDIQGEQTLHLGEKALVVIKGPEGRRRRSRNASLVILGGKVRGSVGPGLKIETPMELVTAAGTTTIDPEGDAPAEFSVTVNPDQSSTVSIFSGSAEIRTEDGTTRIGANQSLTLSPTGEPAVAMDVPDAPLAGEPSDGHVFRHGSIAPRVQFTWDGTHRDHEYLFTVARDPSFVDLVYSEQLAETEFVHGDLEAGRYYWQVRTLDGNVESRPTPVRRFDIVADLDPPTLTVELPELIDGLERLPVRGKTEPGSQLFIGNEAIAVGEAGSFEYTLELEPGLNMVIVEAVDTAGNSAYFTQYVNATRRSQP